MVNALELLQNYRQAESQIQARDQQMQLAQAQEQRNALMAPIQRQALQQNMMMQQRTAEANNQYRNAMLASQERRANAMLQLRGAAMSNRSRPQIVQGADGPMILNPDGTAKPVMDQSGKPVSGVNASGKAPPGYRFKQDGTMEPIPGGPADLKAAADQQKKATGAEDVGVALTTLRDAYNRLEEGSGITSTTNSARQNLQASLSSSGVGQAVGRAMGTQNQSARNDIAMARPALLASLMKATGMSAKQMDSNAELKLWLSTATDPTLDIQANRRALDNIERKYLSNAGTQKSAPSGTQPAIPKNGEIVDGHMFLGGNPADPNRWKKVGK